MSEKHEAEMQIWKDFLGRISSHINGEDKVLHTRAKKIKALLGNEIEDWLACDKAHTVYTSPEGMQNEEDRILAIKNMIRNTT